ncbi:hypothetical protein [Mycobacterium sp. C31M]
MTVPNDQDIRLDADDIEADRIEDVAADKADDTAADEAEDTGPTTVPAARVPARGGRKVLQQARRHIVALVLVALLAVAGGVTGWLYATQFVPDRATNAAAADAALTAAKDGTVAMLSYAPESLDQDFTDAKTHLTGDFLNYYNQFTEQIVAPAATKKSVSTTAAIVNAALVELQPDSAVVLVFLNQTTTSTENPDGSFSTSAVKVGLKKVDDSWLISAFDPV